MSKEVRCECGGTLHVVQEVSGSFTHDVDNQGRFSWDDRDFHGDINEFVECTACEAVQEATISTEEYITLTKNGKDE